MEKTKVIINGWMDKENVILHVHMIDHKASLMAQTVKNIPAMQETQVQSLGLENPLEKGRAAQLEIKPVNPKRKSTLSIHWTDWCWSWSFSTSPPDAKSPLIRKDPDAGKDWKQKEKRVAEDEMVK